MCVVCENLLSYRVDYHDVLSTPVVHYSLWPSGIWKSRKELIPLREIEKTFHPQFELQDNLLNQMKQWEKALQRCTKWHSKSGLNKGQS